MIRRLSALFDRYVTRHLDVTGPGFGLTDAAGTRIGQVDLVRIRGNRIRVTGMVAGGWADADISLSIRATGARRNGSPRTAGADMPDARPFDLSIPHKVQDRAPDLTLVIATGADPLLFAVPVPRTGLMRAGLALAFGLLLLRILPAAVLWRLTGHPDHRATIKRLFGLQLQVRAGAVTPALLHQGEAGPPVDPQPITIILPVYNAFDLLAEVLTRVVAHTDLPWHLVMIEDCSTDRRVRPYLRDWAATESVSGSGRVTLIENAQNLGFIGSVNRGLGVAITRGHHVVLLNSDAFVPANWATRLMRPILTDDTVASVTPMSNDAEIFSSPALCRQTVLNLGMADLIDATARRFNPAMLLADAPTGVGFCMALNIGWLSRVPSLDPVFGRGYGEEVDWCQKIRALGGRHVGTAGLYVEHRGGTSFGSEDKRRLVAMNNATIARRYPDYDGQVQDFIAADPLFTARLALAVAWAAAWAAQGPDRSVPVYLAHTLGGGAEKYLERRIADDLAASGRPAIVLRVGGMARWQVEVTGPTGTIAGMIGDKRYPTDADTDTLLALLAPLGRRQVVYSCGVGDPDPVRLPAFLLHLAGMRDGVKNPDTAIEILFHDYFALSPAYTLLDADGVYRGPLTPASLATRPPGSHSTQGQDGTMLTLADWHSAWGALVAAADRLIVFSDDSRTQVLAVYPDAADRLLVQPHPLLTAVPRLPLPVPAAPPVIGVLGNIGAQKGAGVICDLAALPNRKSVGLVLIGNIDPDYTLPPGIPVHGDYLVTEIPTLVAHYGITHWLIPSIWPETFSYTTHEALATGLPVLAFDLGAQGAAVAQAPNGVLLPFSPTGNLAQTVLNAVMAETPKGRVQDLT